MMKVIENGEKIKANRCKIISLIVMLLWVSIALADEYL